MRHNASFSFLRHYNMVCIIEFRLPMNPIHFYASSEILTPPPSSCLKSDNHEYVGQAICNMVLEEEQRKATASCGACWDESRAVMNMHTEVQCCLNIIEVQATLFNLSSLSTVFMRATLLSLDSESRTVMGRQVMFYGW